MNDNFLIEIRRMRHLSGLINEARAQGQAAPQGEPAPNTNMTPPNSAQVKTEVISGEDENYNYKTFDDFLNHEYGPNVTDEEISEAIRQWASNYMMGLNPGDFQAVAARITPEIYDMIKYQASENYIDELKPFLRNES